MDEQTRQHAIHRIALQLRERRLLGPARLMLDTIEPVAFLASQVALFARPFIPSHGQWRTYIDALTDEQGWTALKQSLNKHEC